MDASRFKGGFDGGEVSGLHIWQIVNALGALDCRIRNPCPLSQIVGGPFKQGASRPNLRTSEHGS